MKQIVQAGVFKAQCLKMMDQVQHTHQPLLITKRGKPIVKVVPIGDEELIFFGKLKGTASVTGDLLKPIDEVWDADS